MCGINGVINWGDSESLARMTSIQGHRGPDDFGTWETCLSDGSWVGLGSRRLAILDLSAAGHMPMSTSDGRFTIVYNGEVYNYPQLRGELIQKGYRFRSRSDTEAVLYLYQEYGPESVRRLNGMFAIAIWDRDRQELFLARDHFGIKPLYYCHQGNRFAFASESKAILEVPALPRGINLQALHQYLTCLWVPDPLTLFHGILKLPAGHYALYRAGELRVEQYWDLRIPSDDYEFKTNEADLAEELRHRFTSSVNAQLLSDVPVAAFLSAGLDSSSIVAAMAQSGESVRTYTIGFPDSYRRGELTLDDTNAARRTADHFGCNHTEIVVTPDVVQLLPKLVWHMDEPVADPAIIPTYLVSRDARKSVTVLLSGVGGDELFAGYRKYQAHALSQRYQHILPAALRQKVIEPLILALPALHGTSAKGYVRLAKKMARSGSLSKRDRFLMDSTYLTEEQKTSLYSPTMRAGINGDHPWSRHQYYFDQVADADFLNQMLYLDTKAFMVSLNLNYNDKMSMASSVEVRVPFLDWELAEWVAWNIPPRLKLHRGTTKHILREAMRPLLPPEVLKQKKAGLGAPIDYWLANDLREMVDDLLSETRISERGLFNPVAVRRLIDQQRRGRRDWSFQIWQFLTLELWMQAFTD